MLNDQRTGEFNIEKKHHCFNSTVKDWGVLQFYLSFNYCSLLSQRSSRQTTANSQLNRSELFFKTSEHNNVSEISPKWL